MDCPSILRVRNGLPVGSVLPASVTGVNSSIHQPVHCRREVANVWISVCVWCVCCLIWTVYVWCAVYIVCVVRGMADVRCWLYGICACGMSGTCVVHVYLVCMCVEFMIVIKSRLHDKLHRRILEGGRVSHVSEGSMFAC